MIDDRHHDFNSPATIAKTTAAVPYTQSHSFQPSDHLLRKRLDLGRMNELLSQVAAEPSPKQSEFVSRPAQQTVRT